MSRSRRFADASFSGAPRASRVERQFSTGTPGFGGDPEFLTLLDSLPPAEVAGDHGLARQSEPGPGGRALDGLVHAERPPAATRSSCRTSAPYRLFIDDRARHRFRHAFRRPCCGRCSVTFGAGPHKVVFEQTAPQTFGRPFWRVAVVRDGTFVEPLAKQLAARADAVVLAVGFDSETRNRKRGSRIRACRPDRTS